MVENISGDFQNINLEEDDMLDTIISGGKVVTPAGPGYWDIGISCEKIVVVAMPGILSTDGANVIDATGKIVVPGGIEPHAHAAANV